LEAVSVQLSALSVYLFTVAGASFLSAAASGWLSAES
jgi:hypothetical protein